MVKAIVGANWGDEGKGKITDVLANNSDVVIRFQGGANAGHTIINNYGKFALHQLPSGVFHHNITNVIGNGVAFSVENFIKEMKNISDNIKQFPYIGMDTEFPGTLYSPDLTSYQAIKQNVDNLKLIQVGITLSDKQGNRSLTGGIWQFNLKFSLKSDKYAKDSITMLTNCGIDFEQLEHNGIEHEQFAEYLLSSGLILNDGSANTLYIITFLLLLGSNEHKLLAIDS